MYLPKFIHIVYASKAYCRCRIELTNSNLFGQSLNFASNIKFVKYRSMIPSVCNSQKSLNSIIVGKNKA